MPASEPPYVNFDEALVGPVSLSSLGFGADGLRLSDDEKRQLQEEWVSGFAKTLYGPVPEFDGRVTATRVASDKDPRFSVLHITIEVEGGHFEVDAGLWLPKVPTADVRELKVPLIVALDFLGPMGVPGTDDYPLDPRARITPPHWFTRIDDSPLLRSNLHEVMRGTTSYRWPIDLILERGWGVLMSCYGSWVPDDEAAWRQHGVVPLLDLAEDPAGPGTISLWSWAISRLVDVALLQPETDPDSIAVIGFSRLGMATLWASANDTRIAYTLVHQSGAAGASVAARNFGETLDVTRWENPNWLLGAEVTATSSLDQHQLLAAIWPRHLYVASALNDIWADPRGEYLSFTLASTFWDPKNSHTLPPMDEAVLSGNIVTAGAIQYHCRPGGHELIAYDWVRYLEFLTRRRAEADRSGGGSPLRQEKAS